MQRKKWRRREPDASPDRIALDNWSALREYLQYAPEKIQMIRLPQRLVKQLETELKNYSRTGWQAPVTVEDLPGLQVEVQLQAEGEWEFRSQLEATEESSRPQTLLALDQINDSRNLGAIVRSAAFFGVTRVIVPKKNQAPLNAGALAAAQGAFAHVQLVEVVNLSRALQSLKELGYWVYGADLAGTELGQIKADQSRKVIVLGNESRGLRPLVGKQCDILFKISGAEVRVESLNVSVAAGIALNFFARDMSVL